MYILNGLSFFKRNIAQIELLYMGGFLFKTSSTSNHRQFGTVYWRIYKHSKYSCKNVVLGLFAFLNKNTYIQTYKFI